MACAVDLVVFSKIFEFANYGVKGRSVLAETLERGCKGLLRNDVIQERNRFTKADLYRAWHFPAMLKIDKVVFITEPPNNGVRNL